MSTLKIKALVVGGALVLAPLLALGAFHGAVQEKRQELKQNVQERKQEIKQDAKSKVEALRKEAMEKRSMLRDEVKKKREDFKEKAEVRRDELKKKLGEKRAINIEKFFSKMVEKFENAVDRLGKFADRIEERLNKAADRGKDVVALRDKLAKAREKITAAQSALTDGKTKYGEAVRVADFKVAFKQVKEVTRGIKEKVKEAHAALVDVIRSTKGLGIDEEKPATPPAPAPAPTQ